MDWAAACDENGKLIKIKLKIENGELNQSNWIENGELNQSKLNWKWRIESTKIKEKDSTCSIWILSAAKTVRWSSDFGLQYKLDIFQNIYISKIGHFQFFSKMVECYGDKSTCTRVGMSFWSLGILTAIVVLEYSYVIMLLARENPIKMCSLKDEKVVTWCGLPPKLMLLICWDLCLPIPRGSRFLKAVLKTRVQLSWWYLCTLRELIWTKNTALWRGGPILSEAGVQAQKGS